MAEHVKFISYTGKYPNLCSGILTLNINGEVVCFGHDFSIPESWLKDGNYDAFWCTGGSVYFTDEYYNANVEEGPWDISEEDLPDKYKKYAAEIKDIFNEEVPWGCCGGCI